MAPMLASAGSFHRAPWNPGRPDHAPVSWAVAGLILAIHTWVASAGGPGALSSWFLHLGLSREAFLTGELWQLLSYGLLHGSWWHVGLNALLVWMVGARIERIIGSMAVLRVVAAGVLAGGIGHLLLGQGVLVGLSGGCMALLLLLTTLSPQSRMLPLPVSGRSLGLGLMLAEGLLAVTHPALGLPGSQALADTLAGHGLGGFYQISHGCHLGGGLAGWLYGRWILRPRVSLARLRRDRERRDPR